VQIKIPDREETPNNMFAYDSHCGAVLAIRDNPNAACAQHCIMCRGQHRFENCPTLNNHDFLKQHLSDSVKMFVETKLNSTRREMNKWVSWIADILKMKNPIATTVLRIFPAAAAKFVAAPPCTKRQT